MQYGVQVLICEIVYDDKCECVLNVCMWPYFMPSFIFDIFVYVLIEINVICSKMYALCFHFKQFDTYFWTLPHVKIAHLLTTWLSHPE